MRDEGASGTTNNRLMEQAAELDVRDILIAMGIPRSNWPGDLFPPNDEKE